LSLSDLKAILFHVFYCSFPVHTCDLFSAIIYETDLYYDLIQPVV